MKDMWGKTAYVGVQFVHPLRQGSSVWIQKYMVVEVLEKAVRASRIDRPKSDYEVWVYEPGKRSEYVAMTNEERAKVDAKTVMITTFSNRSTII